MTGVQTCALPICIMEEKLPEAGVEFTIIPRKEANGIVISASTLRQLIHEGDFTSLADYLPESSLDFFQSEEAAPVIERIKKAEEVVHY